MGSKMDDRGNNSERRAEVLYFAYGSNMLTARLRARVPSCKPLGGASLPGHELRFHKRSKDGSGKCNALRLDGATGVMGVLFGFDASDRAGLDRAEGRGAGYDDTEVTVLDAYGGILNVLTYLAGPDYIDDRLKPYSWYRELVIKGAREHGLPQDYVAAWIETVKAIKDPDRVRDANERAVLKG
jgi:hypothetical protein